MQIYTINASYFEPTHTHTMCQLPVTFRLVFVLVVLFLLPAGVVDFLVDDPSASGSDSADESDPASESDPTRARFLPCDAT